MANDAKNRLDPLTFGTPKRSAVLDNLELDAQLVAHAMKHGRKAFMAAELRSEVSGLIDSIGRVLAERGNSSLLMLGVTMERRDGEIWLRCGQEELIIQAGVEGLIEVGDHAVRPRQPFYTDENLAMVQRLIVEWAVAVAGDERALWSRRS